MSHSQAWQDGHTDAQEAIALKVSNPKGFADGYDTPDERDDYRNGWDEAFSEAEAEWCWQHRSEDPYHTHDPSPRGYWD